MPRYKAVVEYLGSIYAGWQTQPNARTIQDEIEHAIFKFCGQKIKVCAAGRTDSGVHAIGQVIHFDLKKSYSTFEVFRAVNFYLKKTCITFIEVSIVDDSFDARFSAIKRHYLYKIVNRIAPLAIEQATALHVSKELNLEAMQEAAKFLIGKHDFSSFRSSECTANNPVKTLSKLYILSDGQCINIYICASSFLHHMVRNIIGTLILIGRKKIPANQMEHILMAKSRKAAGPTAPAHGLYLLAIEYGSNYSQLEKE